MTDGETTVSTTHYDHYASSESPDPFPEINELRERCPVAHSDAHGGIWVLSKFDDVCAVARDPLRYSSEANGISIPHHGLPFRVPPIELDPPQHMVYRHPLTPFFTADAMEKREDDLRRLVTTLIDEFIERGEADFAQELTIPFPSHYVVRLLGLPDEDTDQFVNWGQRIMSATEDQGVAMESAMYFNELFEDRRRNPIEDIPSVLAHLEVDGEPIEALPFIATMTTLYTAGLDTTANAGALILELLARQTDIRDALREDPERIPAGVEELLRYITPLPALHRTAAEDVEIRGETIGSGERVQLNFMGGNHDPERFEDPERVDIDRDARGQLAFGDGPHKCLGQHLARIELRILLGEVLSRMPDYELVPDGIKRYRAITRGVSSLRVRFTPGRRAS